MSANATAAMYLQVALDALIKAQLHAGKEGWQANYIEILSRTISSVEYLLDAEPEPIIGGMSDDEREQRVRY